MAWTRESLGELAAVRREGESGEGEPGKEKPGKEEPESARCC